MLPLWVIQHVIEKPEGSIPDFLKGFWNGFKGKKSTPTTPAGQTYIFEETSSIPEEDNTLLYFGIGAGIIIFIIVIIAMTG